MLPDKTDPKAFRMARGRFSAAMFIAHDRRLRFLIPLQCLNYRFEQARPVPALPAVPEPRNPYLQIRRSGFGLIYSRLLTILAHREPNLYRRSVIGIYRHPQARPVGASIYSASATREVFARTIPTSQRKVVADRKYPNRTGAGFVSARLPGEMDSHSGPNSSIFVPTTFPPHIGIV